MENIITIENGERVAHTFSDKEYATRLTALRELMTTEELEAIIFTSYHNINYYSDFLFCHFGRFYAFVVTPCKATLVSANIDGGQPWRRVVGNNLVYTDWQRDNFFRAIQKLAPSGGRVGIEQDNITVTNLGKFIGALSGTELVDIAPQVMALRMVKSDEEIRLIKQGAEIADIGGAACVEAIAEEVPEHEVAMHSTNAMIREIATRFPHAELMDTWTWFQSGINTDGAHNPVTSRKIQKGDILSLNCFPMIAGYYTALERTLFFNHVSDEHLRLWNINIEVHQRGLELIRPGIRCCDIARELNEIYRSHDLLKFRTFGYGHSFGVLSHYYGREAGLELREDIETMLEPNMVISMEPMIMLPEGYPGAGGYREHDILVLTNDGSENITTFPCGPQYNVIGSQ